MRARGGRIADIGGAWVEVVVARVAGRRRRAGHTHASGANVADGTRVAVLAGGGDGHVRAGAGRVANVVGAVVPVVRARGSGREQPAARRAADVIELAVFQGVDHAVPALGEDEGSRNPAATGGEGAGHLLAVARAAVRKILTESSDLPGDGELARGRIHGTRGGEGVRRRSVDNVAHHLEGGSRLHIGDGEGGGGDGDDAHVVAAQIDRRRGRRRPEGRQQCREHEPTDRAMLHGGSPTHLLAFARRPRLYRHQCRGGSIEKLSFTSSTTPDLPGSPRGAAAGRSAPTRCRPETRHTAGRVPAGPASARTDRTLRP